MKLIATVAALAALAPAIRADGASILAAINNADSGAIKFNQSVTNFKDAATGASAFAAVNPLLNTINAGTNTAQQSAALSNMEAMNLVGPVNTLVTDIKTTLNNIVSKKSLYQTYGYYSKTKTELQNVQAAADAFSDAVIAKVPSSLQSYAQSLVAPMDPAFQNAISQFS